MGTNNDKDKPKLSAKERRKKFSKWVSADMYGRKFSGIGEGAPLVCDVCGKRVHKIKRIYKDGVPYWVCDKCPR